MGIWRTGKGKNLQDMGRNIFTELQKMAGRTNWRKGFKKVKRGSIKGQEGGANWRKGFKKVKRGSIKG